MSLFRPTYLYIITVFFFNDPAPPEIYPLSLHDALPILSGGVRSRSRAGAHEPRRAGTGAHPARLAGVVPAAVGRFAARPLHRERAAVSRRGRLCSRSEEHTSELQSRLHLVCRLLLEKKK